MRAAAAITVMLIWARALNAQGPASPASRARADTLHRDPVVAATLGTVIPGAGHIYAGEYRHGLQFYFGTVSMLGSGSLTYLVDRCTFTFDTSCKPGPQWPHRTVGALMVGIGLADWVYSAVDAPRAARRENDKYQLRRRRASPVIRPSSGGNGRGADVGLAIAW